MCSICFPKRTMLSASLAYGGCSTWCSWGRCRIDGVVFPSLGPDGASRLDAQMTLVLMRCHRRGSGRAGCSARCSREESRNGEDYWARRGDGCFGAAGRVSPERQGTAHVGCAQGVAVVSVGLPSIGALRAHDALRARRTSKPGHGEDISECLHARARGDCAVAAAPFRVSRGEEDLEGFALVHGAVAVRCLFQDEGPVEDPAGIDRAVQDGVRLREWRGRSRRI